MKNRDNKDFNKKHETERSESSVGKYMNQGQQGQKQAGSQSGRHKQAGQQKQAGSENRGGQQQQRSQQRGQDFNAGQSKKHFSE